MGQSGAKLIITLTASLSLLTSGCQPPPAAITTLPELPGTSGRAAPRVNGKVGAPEATLPPEISYGGAAGAPPRTPPPVQGQETGDISLDFADTDIREVVAQILGNILHVNYTIDPAVHGVATFRTARPLTRAQLLPTLQTLLAQNGAALVQSGPVYRIIPAAQTTGARAVDGLGGTVVVPLRYAAADDLAKLLQPYVGEGGKIVADPGRNAVLISGEPQARGSLVDLVRTFATDLLARQSYALLPVSAGDVRDFAGAMQDAFRGQSGGALAGMVRVVPMSRVNAVLVVSQQPRYIDEARRVYRLVERVRQQKIRSWHVYYLQNSNAEDIAYVMQQAFTPNNVTAQPVSALRRTAGGLGAAGLGMQQLGGVAGGLGGFGGGTSGLLGGGGLGGGFGGGLRTSALGGGGLGGGGLGPGSLGGGGITGPTPTAGAAPGAAPTPGGGPPGGPAANPLLGPLETGGGGEAPTEMLRIIPDPQNNALLFYGTEREAGTIEAMLHKIDILPLQVRIDAVIAEVTLNDALQYGTQFYFVNNGTTGILSYATTAPGTSYNPSQPVFNTPLPAFIFSGRLATGVPFALTALQNITTVNVLSSPQLLVLDNQPARLQVGNVVPYLAQSSQSTISANAPVVNSINYQQTGVIMEITPRVNSGGLVTLDIAQDVSDVVPGVTTPGINSPTFSERNVTSRVVVQDGQTVGLAGLIRDNVSKGNQGIPWLKDIPLLGALASQQTNSRMRTELLILITPHVMHDQRGARALTEDLREHLINAAAVSGQLNNLLPSGSADPNERLRQRLHLQP
ncbi:MAG: type II secretion system secretin GspD [Acetobacteraceae bacterium]|nr:type II secretion system secretin GspD [Acetobacteraceae bacterium]